MKTTSFILTMGLIALSSVALANDQAKIALAKKAIKSADMTSHASPSLKKMLKQARAIENEIDPDGLGCELFDNYYLDLGQDHPKITNLNATVLANGKTRATFKNYGNPTRVDFSMSCQGNKCVIEDVNHIRAHVQYIIKHRSCPQ